MDCISWPDFTYPLKFFSSLSHISSFQTEYLRGLLDMTPTSLWTAHPCHKDLICLQFPSEQSRGGPGSTQRRRPAKQQNCSLAGAFRAWDSTGWDHIKSEYYLVDGVASPLNSRVYSTERRAAVCTLACQERPPPSIPTHPNHIMGPYFPLPKWFLG